MDVSFWNETLHIEVRGGGRVDYLVIQVYYLNLHGILQVTDGVIAHTAGHDIAVKRHPVLFVLRMINRKV